jgi:hypothetical protein
VLFYLLKSATYAYIYLSLFHVKQKNKKIKNKFVLKSATCNRVLKLGTKSATFQAPVRQFRQN